MGGCVGGRKGERRREGEWERRRKKHTVCVEEAGHTSAGVRQHCQDVGGGSFGCPVKGQGMRSDCTTQTGHAPLCARAHGCHMAWHRHGGALERGTCSSLPRHPRRLTAQNVLHRGTEPRAVRGCARKTSQHTLTQRRHLVMTKPQESKEGRQYNYPKPFFVLRDTLCSCEAYGMRPMYRGKNMHTVADRLAVAH